MSNLKVNNRHLLKIRLNKDEYWDFYIDNDEYGSIGNLNGTFLYDDCLIGNIDLGNDACWDENGDILTDSFYNWPDAIAEPNVLYNIGYTGIDNGLFTYRKDRIGNADFYDIFTKSKYRIEGDDVRLRLHPVSGNTLRYEYPLHRENNTLMLNGGFYQGFFMTRCNEYAVLPVFGSTDTTYNFQFTLKKCDLEPESDKTLNDTHPDNKGLFFYIGTRAENKLIYWYDKDDREGLESCNMIGVDDFVEDGEIEKNTHIIDNFFDPNPIFDSYNPDPFELGDYTDYSYYDNDLYYYPYETECMITDLDLGDYVETEYEYAPLVPIYEEDGIEHETLEDCLCTFDKPVKYRTIKFFRGCGCGYTYKKVPIPDKEEERGEISKGDYVFSYYDEYIDDFEDLDYDTEFLAPEISLHDFEYMTDNGFTFSETNQYYFYTDNKFMLFDRTKQGKKVSNWIEGTKIMYYGRKTKYKGNLFLLLNRTPTGYNVSNIDELIDEEAMRYNVYNDVYNNALGFRITDDGRIGYRFLTVDCEKEGDDKTTIIEGYSSDGIIKDCEWQSINIRMKILYGRMMFMFYVDGKLVYITKWMPKIQLRKLNDLYEKQEGVPYNISLGGGSQGLSDVIQQNYMIESTREYPIERYFAGTFIGYIKDFRIFECDMDIMGIRNNFLFDSKKWELADIY